MNKTGHASDSQKLLQHANNLKIRTYLHNSSHLLDEGLLTMVVSTVAVTPVCERIHRLFDLFGTGS